jgi:hypothetical protein
MRRRTLIALTILLLLISQLVAQKKSKENDLTAAFEVLGGWKKA